MPGIHRLAASPLPPLPRRWLYKAGWTKYDSATKKCYAVDFPEDRTLVFDVEVLMSEGSYPTLAVAASQTAWSVLYLLTSIV